MSDREYTLSRRTLLGGLAASGTASAALGAGSFALFSDTERTTTTVSAGTLNLTTDGQSGPLVFERSASEGSPVSVTLRNDGSATGYLNLDVVGTTDSEGKPRETGDTSDDGELAEALAVTATLTGGPGDDRTLCSAGTAFETLFVDNVGKRFAPNYALAPGETVTFELDWSGGGGADTAGDTAGVTLDFLFTPGRKTETASCSGGSGSGEGDGGSGGGGGGGAGLPRGVVFTQNKALKRLGGDGGTATGLGADANNVDVIGPGTLDFDSDDDPDVPFIKNKNALRVIDGGDPSSRKTNLAEGSGPEADTAKTALAVGTWDGSAESVFFGGAGNTGLYRVEPGGDPALVADPAGGVSSVLGPADIDGDGSDELLFVDDSKYVKYLEPGGGVASTGQVVGGDNNVGAGPPATVDGDVRVPIVDDSNQVHLLGPDGITTTLIGGDRNEGAAKAAVAAADIDGDGALEVVYIDNSSSNLKYVDDVTGSGTRPVRQVTDGSGNPIPADNKRGVLPGNV